MAGVGIVLDVRELANLGPRVLGVVDAPLSDEVLDDIGAMLTSGTQERLRSSKVSPDGKAWADWSAAYQRRSRGKAHNGKLERSGAMADSVQHLVSDMAVETGSNMAYARRQNAGFEGTDSLGRKVSHPARPFLGLNDDSLDQIRDIIDAHYTRAFEALR